MWPEDTHSIIELHCSHNQLTELNHMKMVEKVNYTQCKDDEKDKMR